MNSGIKISSYKFQKQCKAFRFSIIKCITHSVFHIPAGIVILLTVLIACNDDRKIRIHLWYGDEQYFGIPGNTQKYINILGNISSIHDIKSAECKINDNAPFTFLTGSDLHRLARNGDFNIEFDRHLLLPGKNDVLISVKDSAGNSAFTKMRIHYCDNYKWPLPYSINWDTVKNIQNVVQVLDGKWELTEDGIRILEPYYDRTLAFGDAGWTDYEVKAEVIFHSYTIPYPDPPNYNVTHAAIASRWPGFDTDTYSPHRKWYPLGATCEFRLFKSADSCSFRILGGGSKSNMRPEKTHNVKMGEKYFLKTRCLSLGSDSAVFSARFWNSSEEEPSEWDIEFIKCPEEIKSGCALIIAHHTELTFGSIYAYQVNSPFPDQQLKIPR